NTGFDELHAQQRRGKRRRPDRAPQLSPQIRYGPDMVLMGMRRHNPEQPIAALDDEGGIGHDDLEPRLGIVPEGNAAVENQPIAGVAVEIQVHPDLSSATERDEEQRARVTVRRTDTRWVGEFF